jgi:hypothetical protein
MRSIWIERDRRLGLCLINFDELFALCQFFDQAIDIVSTSSDHCIRNA